MGVGNDQSIGGCVGGQGWISGVVNVLLACREVSWVRVEGTVPWR